MIDEADDVNHHWSSS